MKYFAFSLFLILSAQAMAQEKLSITNPVYFSAYWSRPSSELLTPNRDFLNYIKEVKLQSVNTYDSNFQRAYIINKDGETISSGFMPSSYFLPNDNFFVISGKSTITKDSFNPYGATTMASAIIFGTFNNFISKLKINRR